MQTDTLAPAKPVVDEASVAVIAAAIAADIGARHGVVVDATPLSVRLKGDGAYATLKVEANYGIFAMAMNSAEIGLRMEPCSDGTVWISVDLRWTHVSGGSNGSTIGTWWTRDGVVENYQPA